MEFNDLQKIWDMQTNAPLYAINEAALQQRILSKKKKGMLITQISELLLIIVNGFCGVIVLAVALYKKTGHIFLYVIAAWMFITAVYVLSGRLRRLKGNRQYDRSMKGDLLQAISVASYQVRLSGLMRWNILPIGLFSMLSVWESGKFFWVIALMGIFFLLAWYAGRWEHGIYVARKQELETLKKKLDLFNT